MTTQDIRVRTGFVRSHQRGRVGSRTQRRRRHPQHRRGGGSGRCRRDRFVQHRRALPPGHDGLSRARDPGCDRRSNRAHPARHSRDRPEYARPGSGLHRIRHARRGVQRPGATHRRSRFADGVISAVRIRPRRLRGASSRRSSICSPVCCETNPSPGRASSVPRSPISTSVRPSPKDICPRGLASEAVLSRWSGPLATGYP